MMLPDLEVLHQLIRADVRVSLADSYGRKMVTLSEPQRLDSSVTILGIPEETVVIKADEFRPPDTVFSDSKGECKRADYVIVTSTDDKKVIICIEMKAGKGGKEREIVQQLKGARCFVTYCQEIGRSFWDQPGFLSGYRYRFVSIRDISIAKQPTRFDRRTEAHDRPEKMLKITGKGPFQFGQLAGR